MNQCRNEMESVSMLAFQQRIVPFSTRSIQRRQSPYRTHPKLKSRRFFEKYIPKQNGVLKKVLCSASYSNGDRKLIAAHSTKPKIGIVGFGNFGQFLGKRLVESGFEVIATSKSDHSALSKGMKVRFFLDANDFAEDHPDIVILSTSIISLESVVESFPFHRLRRSSLIVDVLSVKVFPKNLLLSKLPPELDICCTHPMFGPDSGKDSWDNLPFMFDRVRIGSSPERATRIDAFIQFFEEQGCRLIEMTCEDHDRLTAGTQFLTHTVGRILGEMELAESELDTKGFRSLLSLVNNTSHDSFDLYYGLFMYNQNATEELDRLERAFDSVKQALFKRLHDVAREKLFHMGSENEVFNEMSRVDGK